MYRSFMYCSLRTSAVIGTLRQIAVIVCNCPRDTVPALGAGHAVGTVQACEFLVRRLPCDEGVVLRDVPPKVCQREACRSIRHKSCHMGVRGYMNGELMLGGSLRFSHDGAAACRHLPVCLSPPPLLGELQQHPSACAPFKRG